MTLSPGTHMITAEVADFADDGERVTEVTATDQITVDVAEFGRPSKQFHVRETVGAGEFPADLVAHVLKNDKDVFFDGAEFLSAPPSDGFAGTVENVPGGVEGEAVMLSTGKVEDADTVNEADEAGTDLGGRGRPRRQRPGRHRLGAALVHPGARQLPDLRPPVLVGGGAPLRRQRVQRRLHPAVSCRLRRASPPDRAISRPRSGG